MSAANVIKPVSADDYLLRELDARHKHEYTGGRIYRRAKESNGHNELSTMFIGAVGARIHGKKCRPFNSDTKIRVQFRGETRFYYPDGMVVCDPNPPADVYQDRPVVVAEVISPGTRRVDEFEKREAYLSIPSLTTYLLIETSAPRVVAYERDPTGGFTQRLYEGMDATIPLEAIATSLPLAELYERAEFSPEETNDGGESRTKTDPV